MLIWSCFSMALVFISPKILMNSLAYIDFAIDLICVFIDYSLHNSSTLF